MNSISFQSLEERLNDCLKNNVPALLFRKPDRKEIFVCFEKQRYPTEIDFEFQYFDETGTICSSFQEICQFDGKTNQTLFEKSERNDLENPSEKKGYIKKLDALIHRIKNLEFQKVVFSRKLSTNKRIPNLYSFFLLEKEFPHACVYLFRHPKIDVWIGASPELLLRLEDNCFYTMALAGTKVNEKSIAWSEKERIEQKFVTDYIMSKLKPFAESIRRLPTKTVSAGIVSHLQTNIHGELKNNCSIHELLCSLHPTPAVCGLPKEEAKQYIIKNEDYDREFYSGWFCIKDKKSAEYYVNIRCAKSTPSETILYAGGGITLESNSEKEWEETQLKIKSFRSFF